jgi:hypothetical protein
MREGFSFVCSRGVTSFFVILFFAKLFFFVSVDAFAAAAANDERVPDPSCQEAWNDFKNDHPQADIVWGKRTGRPAILRGLESAPTTDRLGDGVLVFINENRNLFGAEFSGRPNRTVTELVEPYLAYRCDRSEMEPLPGLVDGEWVEPSCPEATMIGFRQRVDGLPYLGGDVIAVFDLDRRLKRLEGEYLAELDTPLPVLVNFETALAVALDHLGYRGSEVRYRSEAHGYKFYFRELLPIYSIRFLLPRSFDDLGVDVTVIVSGDAPEVIEVTANIDGAPNDTEDEAV